MAGPPYTNYNVAREIEVSAQFPAILAPLFQPKPYKVLYGGRGGMKSWGAARAIILRMTQQPTRVLCVREIMKSLRDSVHKLLSDQILLLGVQHLFDVQRDAIKCISGPGAGGEVSFEGIRNNAEKVKSYEGIDICWVEEAASVSKNSWNILLPTIRKEGSEVWITFNPELETDDTYRRWIKSPPENAWVQKVSYRDNPWLSSKFLEEVEHMRETDYEQYLHVYEGHCKTALEGAVYQRELARATGQDRFTKVPYDPTLAVHTAWDLGWSDATAIWFFQRNGMETHFINYYESTLTRIDEDLQFCKSLGYLYDTFWLPHDAKAKSKGTGLSIKNLVERAGFNARIVAKLGITERINAARSMFVNSYFDQEKCADGIQCLRHYQYEIVEDPIKNIFSKEPKHDWTSHGADAFSYAAVAIKMPHRQKMGKVIDTVVEAGEDLFESLAKYSNYGGGGSPTGWMG